MDLASIAFAAVAGALSPLSPCVLPLLPIVLGAATSEHKMGPLALSAGLATSFGAIGFFVSTVGFAIGLDGEIFRRVAASLMVLAGIVLLAPQLQAQITVAVGPLGSWTERRFGSISRVGLSGQFAVGLLLGAVWSPCVGPTLGAASLMAARGENLVQVAFTMAAFGIGAGLPLFLLGLLSREALTHWRASLLSAGKNGKLALGVVLIVAGGVLLSGLDRIVEATTINLLPSWLINLSTRF
jgi:cytochrome c-type biogenesis protein